jgi:tRNA-dihydrouridine synthase
MMYSGRADRNIIKKVKNSVSVPVVGNGDIFCADDAVSMLKETGCDGVMVARGALGRPWIFGEIAAALEGREYVNLTLEETGDIIRRHIELQVLYRNDSLLALRKQLSWYTKGIPGSASLRNRLNAASAPEEFLEIINSVYA